MFKKMLLLLAVVFMLGAYGVVHAMTCHGGSEHSKHAQAAKNAANVGNKVCPVSGEKILEKTKATYEYKGKVYNFCCASCIDEFKKNPTRYIKKTK